MDRFYRVSHTYSVGRSDLAGQDLGNPEIPDLDHIPLPAQHDVLCLQVAMKYLQRVDMVKGRHNLSKYLQDMFFIHQAAVPMLYVLKEGPP